MTNPNFTIDTGTETIKDQGKIKEIASKIGQVLGMQNILQEPLQPVVIEQPALDIEEDEFRKNIRNKNPQTD